MAALLKKRALAEFSQVIQEDAKPPPQKRLRLVQKPKKPDVTLELHNATSSVEALQMLLQLATKLPLDAENAEKVVPLLVEHFYKEADPAVRGKIIFLLTDIVKNPRFNPVPVVDDLSSMLKTEKSHKVTGHIISALTVIGKSLPRDRKIHQQLLAFASQHLANTSHLVRSRCLDLIGALGSPDVKKQDSSQSDSQKSWQSTIGNYTEDQDPRVRTSAFLAMSNWHQRGIKLDPSTYSKASTALEDDHETVRVAALKLIWTLSHLYPENPVTVQTSDEPLRLVDDAFAKLCNMVNDLSMAVRAEAARLLGSLHSVSQRFLEQTLDKKLMSNMRRKMGAHERQKDHYARGEWSTGLKWADDAPKEEVDKDNISLISSGACGALIHGLEDEFMEVRNAAIDSLCELASQSASFAILSQDYLVDMFNDEIDSVRLNAISSLQKISRHLTIREDQLEIISNVLKDSSYEIREALREMFCCVTLETKTCLNACVVCLLDNMKRYPQDRMSIWRCMRDLGNKHPEITLPLVPDLLSIHAYFAVPEPDMDDPAYIAVLILVFNAAKNCPTMLPLFPDHTVRHYAYLRDSQPDMVPQLKIPGLSVVQVIEKKEGSLDAEGFLNQTLSRLEEVENMDPESAQELLKAITGDLKRIAELEPRLTATAECECLYIECQLSLLQVLHGTNWSAPSCIQSLHSRTAAASMEKVVELMTKADTLFRGLSIPNIGLIRQMRLKAQTIQLLHILKSGTDRQALLHKCKAYVDTIQNLQKYLSDNNVTAEPFTQSLINAIPELEMLKLSAFTRPLQTAMHVCKAPIMKLTNQMQRMTALIIEPGEVTETPAKFMAGLTLAVNVDAMLENVTRLQDIYIEVEYPDQQLQQVSPRQADFKQLGPGKFRLVTQVTISHVLWSDPSYLRLGIKTEVKDKSCSGVKVKGIDLCNPVKVFVAPKPVKK
ncbi:integrator complex subunit 4-like [Lineus longissimus]|uniref:integrator complex subunit 4-like n=1 Tax=Lineus longissimus TaxID=88925 RepID=UPI002B4F39D3